MKSIFLKNLELINFGYQFHSKECSYYDKTYVNNCLFIFKKESAVPK